MKKHYLFTFRSLMSAEVLIIINIAIWGIIQLANTVSPVCWVLMAFPAIAISWIVSSACDAYKDGVE